MYQFSLWCFSKVWLHLPCLLRHNEQLREEECFLQHHTHTLKFLGALISLSHFYHPPPLLQGAQGGTMAHPPNFCLTTTYTRSAVVGDSSQAKVTISFTEECCMVGFQMRKFCYFRVSLGLVTTEFCPWFSHLTSFLHSPFLLSRSFHLFLIILLPSCSLLPCGSLTEKRNY